MSRTSSLAVRAALVSTFLMVVAGLPAVAEPDTSRLDELEQELEDLEQGIERRESEVEELDARARELRREGERAQARIEEIEAELSLAVERYNEAVVALEEIQDERGIIVDELEVVAEQVAQLEVAVGDHARRLHKMGPTVEVTTLMGGGDPADLGYMSSTLRRLLAKEQAGLEELVSARTQLDALEGRLAEQEAAADRAATAVEANVVEVEATHARHADELAELTEVLAEVEAQEEAERAQLAEDRGAAATQQEAIEDERAAIEAERQRLEEERLERERLEQERLEQQRLEQERRAEEQRDQERRQQERREQEEQAATPAASPSSNGGSSSGSSGSSGGSGGGSSSGGSSSGGSSGGSSPAPATRSSAKVAVDTALAQVGKPYQWGATGPGSFDCSGLTSYAWRAAGVTIPRTSGAQYSGLTKVSRSQLQPGDLVFYNSPISHVAMYIGNDTIVEAPRTGIPVRTAKLSNRSPVGYARP